MNDDERLETLKEMLEETDDQSRTLSDDRLELLLAETNGNLRRAAYLGAILKSRATGITLPDGTSIESQREYWLTVARAYRGNYTKLAERAKL